MHLKFIGLHIYIPGLVLLYIGFLQHTIRAVNFFNQFLGGPLLYFSWRVGQLPPSTPFGPVSSHLLLLFGILYASRDFDFDFHRYLIRHRILSEWRQWGDDVSRYASRDFHLHLIVFELGFKWLVREKRLRVDGIRTQAAWARSGDWPTRPPRPLQSGQIYVKSCLQKFSEIKICWLLFCLI